MNEQSNQNKSQTKRNLYINLHNDISINQAIHYFIADLRREADMTEITKITQEIFNTFNDVFSGIGCFKGTFSLQVKDGMKPYWAPPRGKHTISKTIQESIRVIRSNKYLSLLELMKHWSDARALC